MTKELTKETNVSKEKRQILKCMLRMRHSRRGGREGKGRGMIE